MIGDASPGTNWPDGPRPVDPYRDLKAVSDLISLAFGGRLDPAGQLALEQMRRVARRRAWLSWFQWPGYYANTTFPGFVWVERGQIVGNVSMRPALERGGFLIGNVCVHPDWRRRGIALALMKAALAEMGANGARWVGLEVREDNTEARRLYEALGFQEAGRTLRMLRPAQPGGSLEEQPVPGVTWRRGGSGDSATLFSLARATTPLPLHPLLELRRSDYEASWDRTVNAWVSGKREHWWIADDAGTACGAVRALRDRRRAPDRLEVLVRGTHVGRLGRALVARGLACLGRSRSKLVETVLPNHIEPLAAAMTDAGFYRSHALLQMRLNMRSAPSIAHP